MLKVISHGKCTQKSLSVSDKIQTFVIGSLDPYRQSFSLGERMTGVVRTPPRKLKNEKTHQK